MLSEDKKLVKKLVSETVDSFMRVSSERSLQKDIMERVKEETEITPKQFRKIAMTYFNSNFSEVVGDLEEFTELYEEIIGS